MWYFRNWRDDGSGKRWLNSTIHAMLTNKAYTGTLVWGKDARDGARPVRVEDAFPAIVTRMDGVAREQRERLETIEAELEEVKRRLSRIWRFVEITDVEIADAADPVSRNIGSDRRNWKMPPRKPGLR